MILLQPSVPRCLSRKGADKIAIVGDRFQAAFSAGGRKVSWVRSRGHHRSRNVTNCLSFTFFMIHAGYGCDVVRIGEPLPLLEYRSCEKSPDQRYSNLR